MTEDTIKPNIEEQYTSATHASSLVVDLTRSGPADKLMAAAWSKSRLGAALLRLHSEADGMPEPLRMHDRAIQLLAEGIARDAFGQDPARRNAAVRPEDLAAAREQAGRWYLHEQMLRMQRLKTLPDVRDQLTTWAWASDIPKPLDVVAGALHWWLNDRCHVCHGQRWQTIQGTGRLSQLPCEACNGSGTREKPDGALTTMVVVYIGDCISASRDSMKRRLRHHQPTKDES